MGALVPAEVVALLDAPAGAYVHVPFCARICPFCPYDKVVPGPGQPERYFAALGAEVRRYLDAGAGPFTSLYVGGGTPTLFPELLAGVVALLPVTGERAIEVLPARAAVAATVGRFALVDVDLIVDAEFDGDESLGAAGRGSLTLREVTWTPRDSGAPRPTGGGPRRSPPGTPLRGGDGPTPRIRKFARTQWSA
ncbi:MAG: hypothetical protein LPK38_05440, partial [Actinomycetes bacterium]|nr:hypothetical protein [Actinomycetes bacterium]MDX5380736.1 hypothetical protein [Actinomycetes bacterium]MDX5399735.1 hypothetical protein [Actinomycetes bacterium]MDX5450474.1 hypothetical protein [Actinomycetes bacterium]